MTDAPKSSAGQSAGLALAVQDAAAAADAEAPVLDMFGEPVVQRRPGRPAGSRSKGAEEWRSFLLGRFQSPVIGMLTIANADPVKLAAQLECSAVQAMSMIQTAQRDSAAYVHSKAPQEVSVDASGDATLILHVSPAAAALAAAGGGEGDIGSGFDLQIADGEYEEIQGLSLADDEKSNAGKSNAADISQHNQQDSGNATTD